MAILDTVQVITCIDRDFLYTLALVDVPSQVASVVLKYAQSQPHIIRAWRLEFTHDSFLKTYANQPALGTRTICWVCERLYSSGNPRATPVIPFRRMYLGYVGKKTFSVFAEVPNGERNNSQDYSRNDCGIDRSNHPADAYKSGRH